MGLIFSRPAFSSGPYRAIVSGCEDSRLCMYISERWIVFVSTSECSFNFTGPAWLRSKRRFTLLDHTQSMEKLTHTLKRGETGLMVFKTNDPAHERALVAHVHEQERAFLIAKDNTLILYSAAESVQAALRASLNHKGVLNRALRAEVGLESLVQGAASQMKYNGSADATFAALLTRRNCGELIAERGFED